MPTTVSVPGCFRRTESAQVQISGRWMTCHKRTLCTQHTQQPNAVISLSWRVWIDAHPSKDDEVIVDVKRIAFHFPRG